jgi:biopolymer transport protein ExbB
MTSRIALFCILTLAATLSPLGAAAQDQPTPSPAEETAEAEAVPPADAGAARVEDDLSQGITLWRMLQQGGPILWIIVGLSVIALCLAVFYAFTISPRREAPATFAKRLTSQIASGDFRGAYRSCEHREDLLSRVCRAGLKMVGHDRYVIQEAMESEGERGATALWQRISYLNNIGVIAPLLGLLGTVWGMIGAFGSLAMDDSQRKSVTMAYSVAQAMVTTAAGLMLAIPAMVVYFYLRSRVIKIVSEVEARSSEIMELLTQGEEQ